MNNFFSKNIQYLRKKRNMERQELADRLGVGLSTVACWENGLRTPNMEMLGKIIQLFNIDKDIVTKDITTDNEIQVSNENASEIDKILFSKAKNLNDEEKKAIIQVMNAIHKEIDKELDNE